jgi:hypothetical protein
LSLSLPNKIQFKYATLTVIKGIYLSRMSQLAEGKYFSKLLLYTADIDVVCIVICSSYLQIQSVFPNKNLHGDTLGGSVHNVLIQRRTRPLSGNQGHRTTTPRTVSYRK